MKLTMNLSEQSYDIIIKRGALSRIGGLGNLQRKVLILTDENVPKQYADSIKAQCREFYCIRIKSGEGSKSFKYFEEINRQLLANNFSRKDAILALGGGVVGDLAGFVAASYMRGISFINVPTTTLSQLDSSIGGKTGINLDNTKNVVGAFYQPELVVIDPDTLKTLPKRHYVNGLAEAIKAGFIADERILTLFETQNIDEALEEIIYRSLVVKKTVVEKDPKESNIRAILNFGHTIGHAIESASGLSELYHGECVALGMLPMMRTKQLQKRAITIFKKLGLPFKLKFDGDIIFSYLMHDKKANGSEITIVTVEEAGKATLSKMPIVALRAMIGEGI